MMYHFILYSLKVAAVLAVFYLFYHLLLSRDTFHRLNRIVLLATAALSFVLARLAVSIFSIRRIIRGGERFPDGQGNTVVVTDKPVAPFSWLRYIVLSQTDWECEREKRPSEILLHEQAHIRYGLPGRLGRRLLGRTAVVQPRDLAVERRFAGNP